MSSDPKSSHSSQQGQLICRVSDLPDPGTLEFSIGDGEWPVPGFIVRYKGAVRAYLNRCPHAGHLLNWKSDDFFAPDRSLLSCNAHGALFEPASGMCVFGPCIGKSLQSLEIEIVDGQVLLRDPPPDMLQSC